jgi:predicted TIM-barrel fold metal-dependent hydrolase
MRFNCHSHVFNLQSVFTTQSRPQLEDRLASAKVPKLFRQIIVNLAVAMIDAKRELFGPEGLMLDRGVQRLRGKSFATKDLMDSLESLKKLNEKRWKGYLGFRDYMLRWIPAETEARLSWAGDWVEFLSTVFAPVDTITDRLLSGMGPEDVTVALMVEYYGDPATANNEEMNTLFNWQIKDTVHQTFRHPGRVLPFLGVDTRRPDHMKYVEKHLGDGSCIGVKIYPSAGFSVLDAKMRGLLKKCQDMQAPVLMHCNRAGFGIAAHAENANPKHWVKLLQDYPDLRICFGHFGGDDFISGSFRRKRHVYPDTPWHVTILDLMRSTDNVYADISFHSMLVDSTHGEKYRAAMNSILSQGEFTDNILWGTDFIMILLQMQDSTYTKVFQHFLGSDFDVISKQSPLRYLGIAPDFTEGKHKANIQRHLEWLGSNVTSIRKHRSPKSKPAPWLPESLRRDIL